MIRTYVLYVQNFKREAARWHESLVLDGITTCLLYTRASVRAARAAAGMCMQDWTRRRVCPVDVISFNLRTRRLGLKQNTVCRLDHELPVKGAKGTHASMPVNSL